MKPVIFREKVMLSCMIVLIFFCKYICAFEYENNIGKKIALEQ